MHSKTACSGAVRWTGDRYRSVRPKCIKSITNSQSHYSRMRRVRRQQSFNLNCYVYHAYASKWYRIQYHLHGEIDIYLFIRKRPNPISAGSASFNAKKDKWEEWRKRKESRHRWNLLPQIGQLTRHTIYFFSPPPLRFTLPFGESSVIHMPKPL